MTGDDQLGSGRSGQRAELTRGVNDATTPGEYRTNSWSTNQGRHSCRHPFQYCWTCSSHAAICMRWQPVRHHTCTRSVSAVWTSYIRSDCNLCSKLHCANASLFTETIEWQYTSKTAKLRKKSCDTYYKFNSTAAPKCNVFINFCCCCTYLISDYYLSTEASYKQIRRKSAAMKVHGGLKSKST